MASFARTELVSRKKELAEKIKKSVESMQAHDMTQEEICKDLDITRRALGRILSGSLDSVSFDALYLCAVGMGMTVYITVPRVLS